MITVINIKNISLIYDHCDQYQKYFINIWSLWLTLKIFYSVNLNLLAEFFETCICFKLNEHWWFFQNSKFLPWQNIYSKFCRQDDVTQYKGSQFVSHKVIVSSCHTWHAVWHIFGQGKCQVIIAHKQLYTISLCVYKCYSKYIISPVDLS